MILTYYGTQFFKIQHGDFVLAANPVAKTSKEKSARFGADVALVTTNHPDFNGTGQLSYGEKTPFIISGPGDYEVEGTHIKGMLTKTEYGGGEKINTVYYIMMEGLRLCFLGAVAKPDQITSEVHEAIDNVDILFVPVGGGEVLSPADAYKLSLSFSPAVIIPMHFGESDSQTLKKFLSEAGAEKVKPAEKLTVKKKDLEGKEGEVFVLQPQ